MTDHEQLQELLSSMDIPISRRGDLRWLSRNLGIRNWQHPRVKEAIKLINSLLKSVDKIEK